MLEAILESIRRSLSRVEPADSASATRLGIVDQELGQLWSIGALAAKHAVHIGPRDLSREQRDAAGAYFERYLAPRALRDDLKS